MLALQRATAALKKRMIHASVDPLYDMEHRMMALHDIETRHVTCLNKHAAHAACVAS
jgi:hypothetical protein